jgi:8-oxo-dGTP diphosphatase
MIPVTCAIIEQNNLVLVTQRGPSMSLPSKWEFPGGKIENGESEETSLLREIKEELGVDIRIKRRLAPNQHAYGSKTILLIPFACELLSGPILLAEHSQYLWVSRDKLLSLDWAPADVPIVKAYISAL